MLLNSIVTKKGKTGHNGTPMACQCQKCDPVPPYGNVKSPKLVRKMQGIHIARKMNELCQTGVVHAWKISLVQREVVDVQITNRINILETCVCMLLCNH